MRKLYMAGLVASVALLAVACSEPDQSARYAQGQYSGKTDTQPWAGAGFGGDKTKWEHAVTLRAQNQNEYSRVR